MNPRTKLYLEQLKKDAESVGGGIFDISPATPSMLGSPYAGNTVVTLPQPAYAPGDDIIFRAGPNKNTLHRVTHIRPGFVFTKGTFNQRGDGWIPVTSIIGKVVQTVRTRE